MDGSTNPLAPLTLLSPMLVRDELLGRREAKYCQKNTHTSYWEDADHIVSYVGRRRRHISTGRFADRLGKKLPRHTCEELGIHRRLSNLITGYMICS